MKRRRTEATIVASSHAFSKEQATSPETRLRRSKRDTSNPPKPSRLQPSTPLHMTTRAASRAATNSTATSVASAESRRSSLADGANVSFVANGMDEEDERPAKRTRRSLKSNASSTSNGSERAVARETNGVDFADNSSQSSSRSSGKRKRNSDIATSIELAVKPVEAPTEEAPQEQEDPENAPPANRRVPPIKRGRGRRPKALQVDTPTYSTDVGSALPSPTLPPENGGPVDGMADGQTQPAKRLPGRRRAPHANPSIEADLRRQLQLKMGYRQVAKMHKVILAELSRRSINEINNDPEAHKRSSQFEVVQKALDDRLALRLQRLESFYEHKKASIERVRTAEQEIQKQMFESSVQDVQEDYQIRLQHKLLTLIRKAQKEEDADATEDEDGPIPPFRAPEIAHLNHEQQEKYDSRSRFFLETEKAWAKAEKQMAFSKKRKQFTEVEENEIDTQAATSVDQFATFDAETRKSVDAIKRHHAAFEAVSVASARLEQEEREAAADLNKDPNALNKLADIAELQRPATPVGRKLAGRTPRSTRTMPSKRSSTENVFAPVDESPAVPPSTLRRSRRTSLSRTRENSPEKQATPQNSIFERSQTPKSSTSKIQDLLNQEPPSQLPPISETAADEPRATMDAVTKSEMGTTDVVHPLHYHQVYVDDLPSIPGLALREDQERQEYRNLDRVPLEVARSWIESVPKIEPSRTPAGRKAGAGSFWSRLGKLPSSREQSVDKDHRPCEGSTSNSLASDRRASDNTPSTARSPRISTPIHIPDSTSGVRHIPGSHSAVETGNADASQNTSPTTNHNRGASLGHRSRQSWESGEAARRASIAVPHQFSSQDRRNQRPSLDPSLLTPIHTQPAPVPGSSRPPPERPYEASTRSDRDRRYSGTGGPPTPSQANYQTYPSPYGQPVPPHYQPNYYGHPPPGYWPAPPPHMLPYGPPPTGAPHTAQAYDQGYYHHPPYSGAPPFPPPPGAYHYPPPHSLPPPHFPPYVGQPIHPASSPTAVGPLPAFPPPGQSPFSEQQGPAPGPNQTEYRRNSSEHARPKSNPPKHGERMGRAAAFRHYDYAKQTRR